MYSLVGLGRLIYSIAEKAYRYEREDNVQDSALLNYIKPWLESVVWEEHKKRINVLSSYIRVGPDESFLSKYPPYHEPVSLYIEFEGKVPSNIVGYFEWKSASLCAKTFVGDLLAEDVDEVLSGFLVEGVKQGFEKLDTSEYIDVSDFLEPEF